MTSTNPPSADTPEALPATESVQSGTSSASQNSPPPRSSSRTLPFAILVALLVLLLGAAWWFIQNDVQQLRAETAKRLQQSDALTSSTQALVKSTQEALKDTQAKLGTLESRQAEAQNQQLALERLYQELNSSRDDWALAEIEQVLSTAAQQLQLAGNVQGALIALQNADRLLAQSDKPQFVAIRSAIASDIERLRALPLVDLTGLALRLDSAIGQIDSLPLLSAEKPAPSLEEPRAPLRESDKPQASGTQDWVARLHDTWQSFVAELTTDLRQVIRVRTVDTPDALLMSPTEAFYARENLKLRLLNARLALLSRNEPAFRNDLSAAQQIISRYFDTRGKQTQTVQTLLKQVQGSNLSIEMPTLSESLTAVRNYKSQP